MKLKEWYTKNKKKKLTVWNIFILLKITKTVVVVFYTVQNVILNI